MRVGRTIETPNVIWQPFASASVFHEFAGNVDHQLFVAAQQRLRLVGVPAQISPSRHRPRASAPTASTLSVWPAQIVNTGWLGFVRVDYRNGDNIEGWTGNAGIRYQFTPEMIAAVMPTKALKAPQAFIGPTNWTGFYVGGFAGAAAGRTDIGFVGAPFPIAGNRPWVLGGLGGIELGYNHQFTNNWVLGVEGDIGAANVHGGRTAGAADGLIVGRRQRRLQPRFLHRSQDKTNWMATVTGRVGYSWGRTLFYAKGGAAFEDSSTTRQLHLWTGRTDAEHRWRLQVLLESGRASSRPASARPATPASAGHSATAPNSTSARTGRPRPSTTTSRSDSHTALATDGTTFLTDKSYISQVKIGVNYRFAALPAVVAKY